MRLRFFSYEILYEKYFFYGALVDHWFLNKRRYDFFFNFTIKILLLL